MFVCQALQLTHCCCCLCCCCCCCCCVSLAKSSSIGQSLFVYLTLVTPLALALAFDRNCQQFTPRLQPATSSWLTIIVNLAYGFFIVASSPVAPAHRAPPLRLCCCPVLTTNHIYCQAAQSLCEPLACAAVPLWLPQ